MKVFRRFISHNTDYLSPASSRHFSSVSNHLSAPSHFPSASHGFLTGAVRLLFPTRCPVCDRPVKPANAQACRKCLPKLDYIRPPFCMKCGKPLSTEVEYCADCARRGHWYDRGVCLYGYRSARKMIYRFKYAGRREYADFLGDQMAAYLGRVILSWRPDALVPVPLHRERERVRGYNQALLLARRLGWRLGIPVCEGWLIRGRNTAPQKLLDSRQRQNNLIGAFKLTGSAVKLRTIVIIDDIYTTGSTIDEIALLCRQNGVQRVYFAALSIGSGQ